MGSTNTTQKIAQGGTSARTLPSRGQGNCLKRWRARALVVGYSLLGCLLAQTGIAVVPSAKIGTAALITPTSADTFYGSATISTNGLGLSGRPNEIIELARALNNDVDKIYDYVRNYVDTTFAYGLQKGELGAIVDKAGTPFDHAQLFVELLRQAGYTATYKAGTITLSGTQFAAWTNITSAQAACQLLANGGIPATINGGSVNVLCSSFGSATVSTVTLGHIWVAVTIPGSTCTSSICVFDPSYKPYTFRGGAPNLATVAGLTSGVPLTQATTGMTPGTDSTVNYIKNLNSESLNAQLTTYAGNLQSYIDATVTNSATLHGDLKDLVGGRDIQRYEPPPAGQPGLRQSALPYTSSVQRSWTGGVPDQYRTTLTVRLTKMDAPGEITIVNNQLLYVDEIYSRKLNYKSNFDDTTFTGSLDVVDEFGNVLKSMAPFTESANPGYSVGYLTLTAAHPYTASADPASTAVVGDYMDASIRKYVRYSTPFTIVHAWGEAGRGLVDKWGARNDATLKNLPANGCEDCWPQIRAAAGDGRREQLAAGWIAQSSVAARLHAEIGKSVFLLHHAMGVVSADAEIKSVNLKPPGSTPDYHYSVVDSFDRTDIDMAFSVTSRSNDSVARKACVHAIAATVEALEGSLAGQTADLPDTVSTAARFEWANRQPAGEDPAAAGPRRYYLFTSVNTAQAANLVTVEGAKSTTNDGVHDINSVEIGAGELGGRRNILAADISTYANAGFQVVANEDAFLGPGQRAGSFDVQSNPALYIHRYSKQRGGAFVATRYSAGDPTDPVEIAHVSVNYNYTDTPISGTGIIKGGGGGAQTTHEATYDPGKAADVLKSRFVDRSRVLGVDLLGGGLTYSSPAGLSVGKGGFPYALSASLIWRGGSLQSRLFSKRTHTEPQAPWTTNWNNTLTLSGSGLEAMGEGDVRAAAGTVAAFLAMQDIYKSAVTSQREVAAVLVGAWWQSQLTGNVVTANVGADTRQFVRKYNGSYIASGAGPYVSLTQIGTRTKAALLTCSAPSLASVATRTWDETGMSFQVANATGDVQNFAFWSGEYVNLGSQACTAQRGFRMTSWTFPYGVMINLVYQQLSADQPDELVEVNNSFGRKIHFVESGYSGFDNGLTGADLRTVTVGRSTTSESGDVTTTHTDPSGAQSKFFHTLVGNRYLLLQAYAADNLAQPSTQYAYDSLNRVKQVQDAVALQVGGRSPYQFFIGDGARGERTDPLGGRYGVLFDLYRHPLKYIDELGRTTSTTVDARGRVRSYTYPEGNQEQFIYDDRNNTTNLTRVAKPGSSLANISISAAWDPTWNKPSSITDGIGCQTTFAYNAANPGKSLLQNATRCKAVATDPLAPVYSFTYNGFGQVLQSSDPTSLATANTYDPVNGNLLSTTINPGGVNSVTSFGYDAIGNLTTVTDPRSYVTENQYDADRRKTVVLHHNGNVAAALMAAERTTYDVLGRDKKAEGGTVFSGVTVTTWQTLRQKTYTPTSKVLTDVNGAGETTTYSYDAMDRPLIVTDPANRRVASVYDLAGQTLFTWRGWNNAAEPTAATAWNPATYLGVGPVRYAAYTYSANGQQIAIQDANNNTTQLAYDGHDRLLLTLYPDPSAGTRCTFASSPTANYDAAATTPTCTAGQTYERVSYDSNGNPLSSRKRDGQVIGFQYDALSRLTFKDLPGTTTGDVYTTYDLAGRPTAVHFGAAFPSGTGIDYGYDTAKRLTSETSFTRTMGFSYDAAFNRTQVTWPDTSNFINYDYDGLNRAFKVRENNATTGVGVLATYSLDPLSRRQSITRGNGTATSYGYDLASRLTSLGQDPADSAQDLTLTLGYTLASQLQTRQSSNTLYDWAPTVASKTYTPDALNRYASVSGTSFTYDGRGNLTADGTRTFTYDVENHLLTVTGGAGLTLSYDPLGRLKDSTSAGVTTQYLYEGDRLVAEYNGTTLLRRYAHGPGVDEPIVWYEGSGLTDRRWLHADERGSITATSDGAGTATVYTYGPYGEPTAWTGPRFRYTGQIMLPEAQLYHYKARVYDPILGRFLQTDPVAYKDDLDLYTYVANDPLDRTDPSGLESVGEMIDSAAEGCGAGSCAGWALLRGVWGTFGAEGVSQVYDKGSGASTGDKVSAVIEVGSAGFGGRVAAAVRGVGAIASRVTAAAQRLAFAKSAIATLKSGGGKVIATATGEGASKGTVFRDAARYAEQFGGQAGDYVKVSVTTVTESGERVSVHAVRNVETGQIYDEKLLRGR